MAFVQPQPPPSFLFPLSVRCARTNVRKNAAARAGKVFYTPTGFYKLYRCLAKLLPHALVVHMAKC